MAMEKEFVLNASDLKLIAYSCPNCGTEVVFDVSRESKTPLASGCPGCEAGKSGRSAIANAAVAIGQYRAFHETARDVEGGLRFRLRGVMVANEV
jgi:hypothetical protein